MNASEKNLIAAGQAYKRAVAASRNAVRTGIPPTRDGKQRQGQIDNKVQLTLDALRSASLHLPDGKKRVGDVWANPRGRHYRITGFEPGGRALVVSTGTQDGAVAGLMVPENGWTLVQPGDGEEEPEV